MSSTNGGMPAQKAGQKRDNPDASKEGTSKEPPKKQPKLDASNSKGGKTEDKSGASKVAAETSSKSNAAATENTSPPMPVDIPAQVQRLLRSGFTQEELLTSRKRLSTLLKEVDPQAELSPEVEEVLLQLSLRFVQNTTEFACKLATHRGSEEINVGDLRLYVEKVLGMKIPGFGSTECGRGSAAAFSYARITGKPGKIPHSHERRLKLKSNAKGLS